MQLPIAKLESLAARHSEIEEMLCQPSIAGDPKKLMKLTKERADLQELVEAFARLRQVEGELEDDREALKDPELRELAEAEIPDLEKELNELSEKLHLLLLPKDPHEDRNTILEIRAGTGGEEAALFAADLLRMYSRFAERRGWKIEVMSKSAASAGGIKEVIAMVKGDKVYSELRFEGGVHRVQRVPATESQGRIHTSTATVAVMPEAEDVDVEIDKNDLKITKTAAGGAGGQHVNTTNSAINMLHIPTGIMVRSEGERSQHQNLATAMSILRAKLLEMAEREQAEARRDERRGMVGTGERSEKIRTYNYPQNRVTDHRIQLTVHNLDKIMDGDINAVLGALRSHQQALLLDEQSRGSD